MKNISSSEGSRKALADDNLINTDPPDPEVNPKDGFTVDDKKYLRTYVGEDQRIAIYVKNGHEVFVTDNAKSADDSWYAIKATMKTVKVSIVYARPKCTNERMEELINYCFTGSDVIIGDFNARVPNLTMKKQRPNNKGRTIHDETIVRRLFILNPPGSYTWCNSRGYKSIVDLAIAPERYT